MKQLVISAKPDVRSLVGADIQFIMDSFTRNMIYSMVLPGQVNRATVHATVSEFWYILEGSGEIWRRDANDEKVTVLSPGVSLDIPVGTAFQYRNTGKTPLRFICITMPPWPGDFEASHLDGA